MSVSRAKRVAELVERLRAAPMPFSMMPLCTTAMLLVAAHLRVRVARVRRAVRRPARVGDAERAARPAATRRSSRAREIFPAALRTSSPLPFMQRDAGRIVAAILQPLEPLDQQRRALPRSDVSDDSAHSYRAHLVKRSPVSATSSATSRERAHRARRASVPSVGASAITRTIGSVPDGRTCTHRSRPRQPQPVLRVGLGVRECPSAAPRTPLSSGAFGRSSLSLTMT